MHIYMLNVDWMQLFDHTKYSVGVMYLVLTNLPRSEHFKRENIFLAGIIPGPCEPRVTLTLLKPPVYGMFQSSAVVCRLRYAYK